MIGNGSACPCHVGNEGGYEGVSCRISDISKRGDTHTHTHTHTEFEFPSKKSEFKALLGVRIRRTASVNLLFMTLIEVLSIEILLKSA
jgi:hypothetical protein